MNIKIIACICLCFLNTLFATVHPSTNTYLQRELDQQLIVIADLIEFKESTILPEDEQNVLNKGVALHNVNAIVLQASLWMQQGFSEKAIALIKNYPNNQTLQSLLIDAYLYTANAKNIPKGLELLNKQVENNIPEAQLYLARLLETGKFVIQNNIKALKLIQKAAFNHYLPAMHLLAEVYLFKRLNTNQPKLAVKWFEKSAFAGHEVSMYNLSLMHLRGEHTPKNLTKSYVWSCVSSYSLAKKLCQEIRKNLTPHEIKASNTLIQQLNIR